MSKKAKTHWLDQMAEEIEQRLKRDSRLDQIVQEKGLLVYDEKTPSGTIHIGSGRGWVIHDAVAKALRKRGLNATFILSSDDFDPFDKMNKELDPEQWEEHLGKPFCDIPSPVEGYESFGDYYFQESAQRFKEIGIECGLESTAQNYKTGVFNQQIKTILDHHQEVQGVFAKLYGEDSAGASKLPFNVCCPNCGKIATTRALAWDKDEELLEFECKDDVVDWAKGCGHTGKISPYNGGGKFPWKVEWAVKWPGRDVIVEFAGKDHFSKGGARTCANAIAVDILDFPPPYPSHGYSTGKGYEFFQIGDEKMSTSKGKGMSFSAGVDFFPPHLLRFLLLKSKPNSVVRFDPEKNDIILLCDQYDRMEKIHAGVEEVDPEEKALQSRIHEICQVDPNRGCPKAWVPLPLASTVIQTCLEIPTAISKLQQMGHLPEDLDEVTEQFAIEKLQFAQRWLASFADAQFIFKLVQAGEANESLSEDQCQLLEAFALHLEELDSSIESKALHNDIYEFARSQETEPKALFLACYQALIQRERGPQLAGFLLTIGLKKSAELIRYSLEASKK